MFACEAPIAETCGTGVAPAMLPALASEWRYETHDAPLVFLANVAEAMHAARHLRAAPTF